MDKNGGSGKNAVDRNRTLKRVQGKPILQHKTYLQRERQLLSAKQLKILLKKKEPVSLAIVRDVSDCKRRQEKCSILASAQPMYHGLTEKAQREHMKAVGPKKSFLTVEERKEEIFQKVQPKHRDILRSIVNEYKEVFSDKLPKGHPPKRDIVHHIETVPGAEPPSRPPYRLGRAEQDEMEEQIKDLLAQGSSGLRLVLMALPYSISTKKTGDGGCAWTIVHLTSKLLRIDSHCQGSINYWTGWDRPEFSANWI